MADCLRCGKKLGFMQSNRGMCVNCFGITVLSEQSGQTIEDLEDINAKQIQADAARDAAIAQIIITTETATNLNITKRIKIIMCSTTSTLDINFKKIEDDLFTMLKVQALAVDANAVVGVTINFVETYSASAGVGSFKNFRIIACGTAVVISDTKLP